MGIEFQPRSIKDSFPSYDETRGVVTSIEDLQKLVDKVAEYALGVMTDPVYQMVLIMSYGPLANGRLLDLIAGVHRLKALARTTSQAELFRRISNDMVPGHEEETERTILQLGLSEVFPSGSPDAPDTSDRIPTIDPSSPIVQGSAMLQLAAQIQKHDREVRETDKSISPTLWQDIADVLNTSDRTQDIDRDSKGGQGDASGQ